MQKAMMYVLTLALVSTTSSALAAGHMKPGLWEMSMKSDMMKKMPKMPPEQLAKMREMGLNIPDRQDGGVVTKVCMTKEMTDRDQPPHSNHGQAGCEAKNMQQSDSGYSLELVCDGENMKGVGKVKGTYSGNNSFASTYDFKGVSHGKPVEQHMESSGKWLSADCGSVKPFSEMMPPKRKAE